MRKDNVMLLYDYFCVKKFPFNQKGIICETNDRQLPYPLPLIRFYLKFFYRNGDLIAAHLLGGFRDMLIFSDYFLDFYWFLKFFVVKNLMNCIL